MGLINERRLAALTRVYALCTADPLPAGIANTPPGFATQVAALKASIANVTALMTAQGAGQRVTAHSTRERRTLRQALREQQLLPLFHAAVTLEPTHPGISRHFRVPMSNAREARLVRAASAMAGEAANADYQPLFAAQLGTDFLDRLNGAIQALTDSQQTNETGRRSHVAATTGVNTALVEGRRAVQYLLAMVRGACLTLTETDAVSAAQTLQRFATAAHVERRTATNTSATETPGTPALAQATQATRLAPSTPPATTPLPAAA